MYYIHIHMYIHIYIYIYIVVGAIHHFRYTSRHTRTRRDVDRENLFVGAVWFLASVQMRESWLQITLAHNTCPQARQINSHSEIKLQEPGIVTAYTLGLLSYSPSSSRILSAHRIEAYAAFCSYNQTWRACSVDTPRIMIGMYTGHPTNPFSDPYM
jgi:uncharacterized membrane protein YhfC